MEIFNYFKFQLNERLTTTMTPDQASSHIITDVFLSNNDSIKKGDFELFFNGRFMIIKLINNYDYDKILYILSGIFSTGYFISQYFINTNNIEDYLLKSEEEFLKYWKKPKYKTTTKYNNEIISFKLKCEPKWDNSIKVENNIYHITNSENTQDILKYGLLPISGKKRSYHPERVYFSLNIEDNDIILKNLKREDKLKGWTNNYDLLEIEIKNLKSTDFNGNTYDVIFYQDPNSNGVYTYDKITPSNIKLFKENFV